MLVERRKGRSVALTCSNTSASDSRVIGRYLSEDGSRSPCEIFIDRDFSE